MKFLKHFSIFVLLVSFSTFVMANSAREINVDTKEALSDFYQEVSSGQKFLAKAKGYVVFPDVNEAGFFLGGKYGEGALVIDGKIRSYHSITAASVGFQIGMQNYALIIAFTSDKALQDFINDKYDDWETELDKKIVMADWTTDDDVDEVDYGSAMVGFAFDNKGMMGKFSMEGTKFETINPDD